MTILILYGMAKDQTDSFGASWDESSDDKSENWEDDTTNVVVKNQNNKLLSQEKNPRIYTTGVDIKNKKTRILLTDKKEEALIITSRLTTTNIINKVRQTIEPSIHDSFQPIQKPLKRIIYNRIKSLDKMVSLNTEIEDINIQIITAYVCAINKIKQLVIDINNIKLPQPTIIYFCSEENRKAYQTQYEEIIKPLKEYVEKSLENIKHAQNMMKKYPSRIDKNISAQADLLCTPPQLNSIVQLIDQYIKSKTSVITPVPLMYKTIQEHLKNEYEEVSKIYNLYNTILSKRNDVQNKYNTLQQILYAQYSTAHTLLNKMKEKINIPNSSYTDNITEINQLEDASKEATKEIVSFIEIYKTYCSNIAEIEELIKSHPDMYLLLSTIQAFISWQVEKQYIVDHNKYYEGDIFKNIVRTKHSYDKQFSNEKHYTEEFKTVMENIDVSQKASNNLKAIIDSQIEKKKKTASHHIDESTLTADELKTYIHKHISSNVTEDIVKSIIRTRDQYITTSQQQTIFNNICDELIPCVLNTIKGFRYQIESYQMLISNRIKTISSITAVLPDINKILFNEEYKNNDLKQLKPMYDVVNTATQMIDQEERKYKIINAVYSHYDKTQTTLLQNFCHFCKQYPLLADFLKEITSQIMTLKRQKESLKSQYNECNIIHDKVTEGFYTTPMTLHNTYIILAPLIKIKDNMYELDQSLVEKHRRIIASNNVVTANQFTVDELILDELLIDDAAVAIPTLREKELFNYYNTDKINYDKIAYDIGTENKDNQYVSKLILLLVNDIDSLTTSIQKYCPNILDLSFIVLSSDSDIKE